MTAFKDHFSASADSYAQFRPTYPAALLDVLGAGDVVWEAGCGSGQLSRLLATRFGKVVATEPSAAQIAKAQPNVQVDYRCEPAEQCSLADASADLAVSAQAAHWFDLPAYYAEVRRVVKPGGRVALVGYANIEADPLVQPAIHAIYEGMLGAYWPPERRYVESRYADLAFPFNALQTPELYIEARLSMPALLGYMMSWSAVKAWQDATGKDARAPIEALLAAGWPEGELDMPFRWPLFVRLGVV